MLVNEPGKGGAWVKAAKTYRRAEIGLVEQVLHRPEDGYTRWLLAAVPELPVR
jgi:ABC-type dipeptide/oligopeptide/nickel transport system ATPase component